MYRNLFFLLVTLLLALSGCFPNAKKNAGVEVSATSRRDTLTVEDMEQHLEKIEKAGALAGEAQLYFAQEKNDLALAAFEQAYQLAPDMMTDRDLYYMGELYAAEDDVDNVIKFMEKSKKAKNKDEEGWLTWMRECRLIKAYTASQDKQKFYLYSLKFSLDNYTPLEKMRVAVCMGEAYCEYKKFEQGKAMLDTAIMAYKKADLRIESECVKDGVEELLSEVYCFRGTIAFGGKRSGESERYWILAAQRGHSTAQSMCEKFEIDWKNRQMEQ